MTIEPMPPPPSPLMGLMSNMLGMADMFRLMSDPQMQAQAFAMMQGVIASAEANLRIEAKLDRLLREKGINPDGIVPRQQSEPGRFAALPFVNGAAGGGGFAVTGGAFDHGTGATACDYPETD